MDEPLRVMKATIFLSRGTNDARDKNKMHARARREKTREGGGGKSLGGLSNLPRHMSHTPLPFSFPLFYPLSRSPSFAPKPNRGEIKQGQGGNGSEQADGHQFRLGRSSSNF